MVVSFTICLPRKTNGEDKTIIPSSTQSTLLGQVSKTCPNKARKDMAKSFAKID